MVADLALSGARVVLPTGVVENGRVAVRGRAIAPHGAAAATTLTLPSDHWIVPGFVDMHVHGGGGVSFSEICDPPGAPVPSGAPGTSGTPGATRGTPGASGSSRIFGISGASERPADSHTSTDAPERVLEAVRTHRLHGTTTMVASTVTGRLDDLVRQASALSELVEQGDIAGIHFEGPFLARSRCGAHEPALLRDPDPAAVRTLLDAARGTARMMTLAPELPGGLNAVRLLADHGVVAAIGHTDGSYDVTIAAVDAGATVATHLFNAMPALGHRAPGPVAALLEDERVTIELINDGVHLHPAVLGLAVHHAGPGRVALVTDAMGAAGKGDGFYTLGGLKVEVRDGVARLAEGGAIAGSTLTLDRAFRRAVTVDGLPVDQVVRAVSANPARLLGAYGRVGSLEPGKDADLVVLDADFRVVGVLHKGDWTVPPMTGVRN